MKELKKTIDKYPYTFEPSVSGITTKVNQYQLPQVLYKLIAKIEENQKELKEVSSMVRGVVSRLDKHDSIIKDIDEELERIETVFRKQYD